MSEEQRLRAADAFWREADGADQQIEAMVLLAQRLKARPKFIATLPVDKKAKHLAHYVGMPDALAARLLVSYHLAHQRPMMARLPRRARHRPRQRPHQRRTDRARWLTTSSRRARRRWPPRTPPTTCGCTSTRWCFRTPTRGEGSRRFACVTAWLVHAFTATGAVLAYLALEATIAGDTRQAFLWLVVATLVDAVDGALARLARVKERTPQFNGARLDDIVDYLTFVFVPVFILRHDGLLPAGGVGLAVAAAVLLSSAYGFSREDAKTADHFFTGFPSVLEHRGGLYGRHPVVAPGQRGDPVRAGGARLRADRLHLPVAYAAMAGGDYRTGRAVVRRDGRRDRGAAEPAALAGAGSLLYPVYYFGAFVRPALPARPDSRGRERRERTPPSAEAAPPRHRGGRSPTCPTDTRMGAPAFGSRVAEVHAERAGACGGNLVREGVRGVGPLAPARPVGPDGGQPRLLRAVDLVAVLAPVLRRAATAVIHRDQDRRCCPDTAGRPAGRSRVP